jgi:D-alanyl-D-alanine carboxypeptidase
MTKVMNLYCTYEALKNGEITLDTVVPISANVYNKSRSGVYQGVYLDYNTVYTVNEILNIMIVYSAGDAAIAMAELVGGGSEAAFVDRMNRKAQEMGIDVHYGDSCGVAENAISPIGMATLARNLIRDYPDILVRSSQRGITFHSRYYRTTNRLLDTYNYQGADGLKTGTTSAAGCCFTGTASRNGNRVITVTMGSSSGSQRFIDTMRLMDYGFAVLNAKYDSIYFTDMRTFINNNEIPTFLYTGDTPHTVIVAEDLRNYGFDVVWDDSARQLTITYNKDKPASPIPMDYYRTMNGQKAFRVYKNSGVKVVFKDGTQEYTLTDIYNVNGYICISVDEFQKFYSFFWNSGEQAAYIDTYAPAQ